MIPPRLRCEFYWPHVAETSAVGAPSLCWLCLQCNCSNLLLPLYIPCLKFDSVCLRCAVARPEFKVDLLGLAEFCLQIFPSEDFQPLVESTVVEFAVVFYLPEILGGDSPTVNIIIIHLFIWRKPGALSSMAIGCLETHNALWRHYSGWCQGGHEPNSIDLLPRGIIF